MRGGVEGGLLLVGHHRRLTGKIQLPPSYGWCFRVVFVPSPGRFGSAQAITQPSAHVREQAPGRKE